MAYRMREVADPVYCAAPHPASPAAMVAVSHASDAQSPVRLPDRRRLDPGDALGLLVVPGALPAPLRQFADPVQRRTPATARRARRPRPGTPGAFLGPGLSVQRGQPAAP